MSLAVDAQILGTAPNRDDLGEWPGEYHRAQNQSQITRAKNTPTKLSLARESARCSPLRGAEHCIQDPDILRPTKRYLKDTFGCALLYSGKALPFYSCSAQAVAFY